MYLNSNYIDPAQLTGYVRAALADYAANRFSLATFLPDRNIDDIQYRFARGGLGLARTGKFRSFDAPAEIIKRDSFSRVTGELPPISAKIILGEYDRLRARQATADEFLPEILSDSQQVARYIAARLELARGQALAEGRVVIEENGVYGEIDFDRDDSMEVTAATTWSTTDTADPIGDLVTWQQAYINLNGVAPGAIQVSTQVLGDLQRTESIRNMAATVVGAPTLLSRQHIQQVFDAMGLPPYVVYDVQVEVDGTATRVIDPAKVLLLPAPVATTDWQGTELGATFWGTTAESLEPGYGIARGDAPGIVAGVYSEDDPVSLITKAAAISVPVLANPNLAMVATVL